MKHPYAALAALAALWLPAVAVAQPEELGPAGPEPATAAEIQAELEQLVARPGGLTADEVARRAATSSPSVRAKRAQIAAADAERDRAAVGWFPRLTLTARYTRLSPIDPPAFGPSDGSLVVTPAPPGPIDPATDPLLAVSASALSFPVIVDQYLLQANVTIPVSDYVLRTSQTYAAASHSRSAADLSERAARNSVAANAKLAYYAWVRARLQHAVARQTVTQTKAHLDAVRALSEADRASRADVLAAESQLASAELLVERADSLIASSEDRLRVLMHDSTGKRYEIGEDLLAPLPASSATGPAIRELLAEAQRKRLELRALDHTAWSLREQKKASNASSYPRLDLFGNAYYANPNPRVIPQEEKWRATWDAGVQLTWTPNDVALGSAASSALEAKRAEIEAQKAELRDALRSEVFDAHQALREAEVAIKTVERKLSSAEEAYRARVERFRYGRASFVELTDAETDLLRARLERIDARIARKTARVRLDHATGRDATQR
jgi:outer membrane protein TolC